MRLCNGAATPKVPASHENDSEMSDLVGIPVIFMRGGTSRGPYFKASDLPADVAARDRVLLAAMGSPDPRQIDGLGGADTLTSKVAIVSKSTRPGVDVDYLFAQVDIGKPIVDTAPSCGNMLAGVAPFAIETGMIAAADGETHVMIFNVNTEARIEAIVQTPGRAVIYTGDARIDGVPGTAAPIVLNFMDVVGSVSGKLMPTGSPRDVIDGIEVSCIDVAMPMIMMRAKDFGLTGYEGRPEINANKALFARIEPIRLEAGAPHGLWRLLRQGDPQGRIALAAARRRHDRVALSDPACAARRARGHRRGMRRVRLRAGRHDRARTRQGRRRQPAHDLDRASFRPGRCAVADQGQGRRHGGRGRHLAHRAADHEGRGAGAEEGFSG